ncbi:MAG TPA: adenosylcobinamide-GDP ribazoletransferase [Acidimicrobiales bacterium]|nr:adenosylcobinamide-GDP ribazoletransferase [Acidimicrobiales bacterium]
MRRAVSFLTPFGRAATPQNTTLAWFPIVGALVGLAVGGLWWLAAKLWLRLLAGAVAVAADLALTGLLHFDGLADAGDGLLAPLTRERRLAAMADPSIGAFGALTVGAVLLLRFGAFASLRPSPLVIAGLWCASRTAMVAITEALPYARPDGLVQSFLGARSTLQRGLLRGSLVGGIALSAALVVIARGVRGVAALGAELIAIALVALFSRRRIGGYTGDVLGAAGVIGETVGLLALAAR